ncbi:MAG: HU family DNA-binding protein [Acidobacteriaceae bacterium]
MTKAELIAELSKRARLTKREAEDALAAFIGLLHEELPATGKVILPEIGTFQVKHRPARKGRNPSTGEEVAIPARNVVAFKAAKVYAERVNAA